MKTIHMITWVLLIVGGLNWLLTGFGFNLVEAIFGAGTIASIVYILVGLSALYELFTQWKGVFSSSPTAM